MKNNIIYPVVLVCLTLLTPIEVLSEPDKVNKGPFFGKVKLGFARMSGNVDLESLNYGFLLTHKKGMNKLVFKLKGNEIEANNETKKKDIETSLLDIYRLNKISAVYGKVSYLENEFIGYKYLRKLGAGYLHTWLEDNQKKFNTRIGYQARFFKEISGDTDFQDFMLVGFRGAYPVMENVLMKTEVNYEVNFDNNEDYESDAELGFTFKVNKQVDLELNYKVKYDNLPVTGIEHTDRTLTTSLVYKF